MTGSSNRVAKVSFVCRFGTDRKSPQNNIGITDIPTNKTINIHEQRLCFQQNRIERSAFSLVF